MTDISTSATEVCDFVHQGKLELGAPCTVDIECAASPGEEVGCVELVWGSGARVCSVMRRVTEGEPCFWTCRGEPNGAECSGEGERLAVQGSCYTNDHLYCADGICRQQTPPGEPCTTDWTCAGSYCSVADECRAIKNEGEDCAADVPCRAGLYCASDGCTPKKATGEQCDSSEECQTNHCTDSECSEGSGIESLTFYCTLLSPP